MGKLVPWVAESAFVIGCPCGTVVYVRVWFMEFIALFFFWRRCDWPTLLVRGTVRHLRAQVDDDATEPNGTYLAANSTSRVRCVAVGL